MTPSVPALVFLQGAALVLLPITAWILGGRRLRFGRTGWAAIGYGCLFFILSQVVATPLRLAVDSLGMPALTLALALSTIGAIVEEGSRAIALRFVGQLREALSRPVAIAYGLGHGGFESLAFGLGILAAGLIANAGASDPLVAEQIALWIETPLPLYATPVLERLFALVQHVGLTLIVGASIVRRRIWLLGIAIAWHAAANYLPIVLAEVTDRNVLVTEGFVLLGAVGALLYGWRALRTAEPSSAR